MPIKIPDNLPARAVLDAEGIVVMAEAEAGRQDIRPMRIGLLNLMPNKVKTETQFARLLGATPLQVELTLVKMTEHVSRHTSADHLASFYRDWADVRNERFDGFIITGAPVETLPFENVTYWDELCQIFNWTQTHVHSSFMICWAAMAAVWHFHGMAKYPMDTKLSGVFSHQPKAPCSPYLRGLPDVVDIPVSRWTEVHSADIPADSGLQILLESDEAGLCLLHDPRHRALHMFNHSEYDTETLSDEYFRDAEAGKKPELPKYYFPGDDPARAPLNRWRGHGHLLFGNWLNEVYQTTPFDLDHIGR
ncbi:MAG: homoserine O-succinyltransferase [Sphingobium sp.]|nr:homoserine O-succinyltransferase [Sphingobium sp.]